MILSLRMMVTRFASKSHDMPKISWRRTLPLIRLLMNLITLWCLFVPYLYTNIFFNFLQLFFDIPLLSLLSTIASQMVKQNSWSCITSQKWLQNTNGLTPNNCQENKNYTEMKFTTFRTNNLIDIQQVTTFQRSACPVSWGFTLQIYIPVYILRGKVPHGVLIHSTVIDWVHTTCQGLFWLSAMQQLTK